MEPVFHADGDRFVPTAHAAGPWDAGLLHGGATASLLVHEAERVPTLAPMSVARVTVELFRPVRVAPLRVATRVLREGKKLQLVEASTFDGETEVARATVLRLRRTAVAIPEGALPPWSAPPGPEAGREPSFPGRPAAWFLDAFECRSVEGDFGEPGPAAVWFRLRRPLVGGETATPAMRAAAVADFGNGVSGVLDRTRFTYVNPDLTVYLHREPAGEWLLVRARTSPDSSGVGLAESILADAAGPFGRGSQSLLIETR